MDTVNKVLQDLDTEVKVIVQIAENSGATVARNKEGQIEDIFFTPYDLLRFADFLITSTVENYNEIQGA